MGKVSGNWITGAHSGRACNHDDIYTKVNKKTGACYSVKLCNPNTDSNETQLKTQGAFALVSKAASLWVKTEKEANSADYKKAKQMYDRQTKYSTLRGMIIAKGMYTVSADKQTVTIDLDARTNFKVAFGIESSAGSGSNDGNTSTVKRTLTLSASPSNGGSVSGGGQYNNGASATITATANSGYTFTRWSDGNTSASRTIVMDANKTLSAIFVTTAGGEVTPNPDEDGEVNNIH